MIDLEVSIYPEYVALFGLRLPESAVIATAVVLLLVLGLVALNLFYIRRPLHGQAQGAAKPSGANGGEPV